MRPSGARSPRDRDRESALPEGEHHREPPDKRTLACLVAADAPERLEEDLRRYVFGARGVTEACEHEAIDRGGMPVVEDAKSVGVALRESNGPALILIHERSLWPSAANVITEINECEGGEG